MKPLLPSLLLAVLLISCQNDEPNLGVLPFDSGSKYSTSITMEQVENLALINSSNATRSGEKLSVSPLVTGKDTMMYVVQYDNGWELYSTNLNAPAVLFSSKEGIFDFNDPLMPPALKEIIESTVRQSYAVKNCAAAKPHSTWGPYALSKAAINKGKLTKVEKVTLKQVPSYEEELPPGHWVLLGTKQIKDNSKLSPKVAKTKWGQDFPFNKYAKWDYNPNLRAIVQCPAGCVAVTLSQFMYHSHYKHGHPNLSPTVGTPSTDGYDYTFSDFKTSTWDNMPLTRLGSPYDEMALLIGYVGREVNSVYRYWGTGSTPENTTPYLTKMYNMPLTRMHFSFPEVKRAIDHNNPVITDAGSTKYANGNYHDWAGHYFLTDQYKITDYTSISTYGYAPDPWDYSQGDCPWPDYERDAEGNIIGYPYYSEVEYSTYYEYVSMNWGYNGSYDNTFYDPTSDWVVGDMNYNVDHYIHLMPFMFYDKYNFNSIK